MKIYEKPMAVIEKINVEDVITTSADVYAKGSLTEAGQALVADGESTIIFEW